MRRQQNCLPAELRGEIQVSMGRNWKMMLRTASSIQEWERSASTMSWKTFWNSHLNYHVKSRIEAYLTLSNPKTLFTNKKQAFPLAESDWEGESKSKILFDRVHRSGLSMSFFLLLLLLPPFRQILILDKNSESLILDKKTGKSHLG